MFAGLCCLLVSGIFGHSMLRETQYIYAARGWPCTACTSTCRCASRS
jgi:hypothetical protein